MIGRNSSKVLRRTIILSLAMGSFITGADYSRDRYDLIVDRSPFGEDPVIAQEALRDAQEATEVLATAQRIKKETRLCYLLKTVSGEIRAGFQNLKAQKGDPQNIMLRVGESFNGMKLSQINIVNSSATLSLNGQPITFELAKTSTPDAVPKKQEPPQPPRRFGSQFRRQPPSSQQPPKIPARSVKEQAKKRGEMRENLRQYQMEVIRAGMPPLPIPLTQEMDNQLVAEGILPPTGL